MQMLGLHKPPSENPPGDGGQPPAGGAGDENQPPAPPQGPRTRGAGAIAPARRKEVLPVCVADALQRASEMEQSTGLELARVAALVKAAPEGFFELDR